MTRTAALECRGDRSTSGCRRRASIRISDNGRDRTCREVRDRRRSWLPAATVRPISSTA